LTIAFENPSHCFLHEVATRAGLRPVGVPIDAQGLNIKDLAGTHADAAVVSPAHQFPTGRSMSESRRAALAHWACETGALIIEDDYNAEFRYTRQSSGPLHALAPDNVAYLGSTSKSLASTLRLGWAVLPPARARAAAGELAANVGHSPGIEQLALADFLRRGELDRHLQKMRTAYRARRDVLLEELDRRFAGHAPNVADGGLHIVLELESEELEKASQNAAASRSIAIDSITQHTLAGYEGIRGLLVGYGAVDEATLPRAIAELAAAFDRARRETGSRHRGVAA
jgi:GntR family transcriptional regulator/MocR family aminotransferase